MDFPSSIALTIVEKSSSKITMAAASLATSVPFLKFNIDNVCTYVYVCMYVCMHAYTYVSLYNSMYVCAVCMYS